MSSQLDSDPIILENSKLAVRQTNTQRITLLDHIIATSKSGGTSPLDSNKDIGGNPANWMSNKRRNKIIKMVNGNRGGGGSNRP